MTEPMRGQVTQTLRTKCTCLSFEVEAGPHSIFIGTGSGDLGTGTAVSGRVHNQIGVLAV